MTATDLARTFGKQVEAVAVYDPYLHYSVFNCIANVLTEQAAKVFRFEEQNQLHEEIIHASGAVAQQIGRRLLDRLDAPVPDRTPSHGRSQHPIAGYARGRGPRPP